MAPITHKSVYYLYIYIYIYIHVYICICMCTYIYIYIYIYIFLRCFQSRLRQGGVPSGAARTEGDYIYIYIYTCIYIYIYVYIYICICICMCIYISLSLSIYIYIYISIKFPNIKMISIIIISKLCIIRIVSVVLIRPRPLAPVAGARIGSAGPPKGAADGALQGWTWAPEDSAATDPLLHPLLSSSSSSWSPSQSCCCHQNPGFGIPRSLSNSTCGLDFHFCLSRVTFQHGSLSPLGGRAAML